MIRWKSYKEDSIAYKIKKYFELNTIQNMMLFKYDKATKEVLVSKQHLMFLLSLTNDVETLKDYNFKIVDKNDILYKE